MEELQEHGLGEYVTYVPAEQVSMPIEISVNSENQIITKVEENKKHTNKEKTRHSLRIFNNDRKQVGYVSLSLTPSGDIDDKTTFYESPDRAEEIRHTIYNKFKDGEIVKDDNFEFTQNSVKGTKKVEICQRNGKVVGASILEQELETQEDRMFQSITEFAKNERTPKLKRYVASCVADETDRTKRGGTLIPWECMTLEQDLFEYQESMQKFQDRVKWLKERTGFEVTLEKAIEIDKMSYDERKRAGIPREYDFWRWQIQYLSDESNDLLKGYKGNYIGNILRLTDKGYEACIVTKHQKDNVDYRLYTLIDLTGTSIDQGTGLEGMIGEADRDERYFKRLKEADRTPKFVTQIGKDGKEELVLYCGNAISGECPEYEEFVDNFIAPFSEIKPIQISKILNKESKKER